jgi:hypothetical protein
MARKNGEWISVSDYAQVMGISPQRVYQKIHQGLLESIDIATLAATEPEVYRRVGRGYSGSCSILVWLSDDETGGKK